MEPRNSPDYSIEGKRGGKHLKSWYKRELSNHYKNSTCLFCRNGQANQENQNNLEKELNWKTNTSWFKNLLQRYSIQNCSTGIRMDICINGIELK